MASKSREKAWVPFTTAAAMNALSGNSHMITSVTKQDTAHNGSTGDGRPLRAPTDARNSARRHRQRGAEILEFALVLAPFLAMLTLLMDISWGIFTKSSIQRAVRVAVDQGVSLTASQMAQGACLTDTVKKLVQQNSFGMLNGSTGLGLIKVNYFQPPDASSNGGVTDVSAQSDADTPGNIMQVSVQNFSLTPLIPRFIDFNQAADKTPLNVGVYAVGVIQLTLDQPCVGTAP